VSRLVISALRDRGYQVLAARNGREAIALYRLHAHRIQLLVTDVAMPVMGGAELTAQLRAEGYRLRVLFTSGYADDALTALPHMQEGIDLLPKPFTAGELAVRVRRALDRGRASRPRSLDADDPTGRDPDERR